ncbi:MAG TPA: phenylalanine--tRNA ligase beta subunit-related protein [Thermomicrobiales bacterium]
MSRTMVRFVVEDSFWQLFPEASIGAVAVRGIDNRANAEACEALLLAQAERTAREIGEAEIGALAAVAPWRSAYLAFGVKPSRYKSSIEGLLRSAKAGRLRSINPLVDLYNTVSLKHQLPCGGEDLGAIVGEIRLTRAMGDEPFVPLGGTESEPPPAGAVIYRDDLGAICSCWNWREADRTKLTEATTDAFLCIEALPPAGAEALRTACDELARLVAEWLGGKASVVVVDRELRAIGFG